MQPGCTGVQREAWVRSRLCPTSCVPLGRPQCPQLSPKGAGTTLCGHWGKNVAQTGWKGHLLHTPTPHPLPTAQLFPRLPFSGCWREPGLFCKTLYTNTTPFSQLMYLHGDGLWEEMGGVGAIISPT